MLVDLLQHRPPHQNHTFRIADYTVSLPLLVISSAEYRAKNRLLLNVKTRTNGCDFRNTLEFKLGKRIEKCSKNTSYPSSLLHNPHVCSLIDRVNTPPGDLRIPATLLRVWVPFACYLQCSDYKSLFL